MSKDTKRKILLIIRDGWGYRAEKTDNALAETPTPFTDKLMTDYPNTLLEAAGEAVGVPEGFQGNSEVGHMTIGAGRILYQSLVRINKAIETGEFQKNEAFLKAIHNAKEHKTSIHLIGLLQTQGVHAHINHLFALLELCKQEGLEKVKVHVITDGRDSPVHESLEHIAALEKKLSELGIGEISTISGRYYTMDRDKRWERTEQSYRCIVEGQTEQTFSDAQTSIAASHEEDITDEFIIPRKKEGYEGFDEHDSSIFFNFRTDRPRQFTQAVVEDSFEGFTREKKQVFYVGMTQFYRPMQASVAFADISVDHLLGEVIAEKGLKQLRISETEKYAHVTFFFNGQKEIANKGEERILIHSPKVATYDLQPEMSVHEIANRLASELAKEEYDFVVTNLVNGDMVGHTGKLRAIQKAVVAVDTALEKIVTSALAHGYTCLVFADHGNVEDQTAENMTSHTTNKVPFILISNEEALRHLTLREGKGLQDIAVTSLALLNIEKPEEMTGENIIQNKLE